MNYLLFRYVGLGTVNQATERAVTPLEVPLLLLIIIIAILFNNYSGFVFRNIDMLHVSK